MNQNIIQSLSDRKKPHVNLVGEDEMYFSILGRTREAMRSVGWSRAEITEFTNKAMAGDYDALIKTICDYCEVD